MSALRFACIFLLVTAYSPLRAWAETVFPYPGLDDLIASATHIVVAEALPPANGGAGNNGCSLYKIRILVALKGGMKRGTESMTRLCALPLDMNYSILQDRGGYLATERYLLFLDENKDSASSYAYRSTKFVGNTFWVPPSSDVSGLPLQTVREALRYLVRDFLAYDNGRFEEIRDVVSQYID